ncbi:hypothetical protein BCF58_0263 [Chryseobacterium defluvii]|uniref:Uncharacterized protein n=1 Tax=Chryseobacterium defluvii TaxID=160396 RepID=A0A495SNF4_9FLAO|nr:hypothetical protein BCF58_0263 [Chryseobacterium defluvii]
MKGNETINKSMVMVFCSVQILSSVPNENIVAKRNIHKRRLWKVWVYENKKNTLDQQRRNFDLNNH